MAEVKVVDEFPDGWEDECLVSSVTTNSDGSLTVRVQIGITSDDASIIVESEK